MKNKIKIPERTKKLIYQEANSSCSFCGLNDIDTLQIHHIYEKEINGGNEPENLILVCSNCHGQITNGSINKSQVIRMKYNLLQNATMKKSESKSGAKIFTLNNSYNLGIIGENINIKTGKISHKVAPPLNSIASDLNKRNYIKRLIDRYQDYKKADTNIGSYKYGIIYNSIKREFKCKWDMIPLQKFDALVSYLQIRIDKTILGKTRKSRGLKNYSSFEEFVMKMEMD